MTDFKMGDVVIVTSDNASEQHDAWKRLGFDPTVLNVGKYRGNYSDTERLVSLFDTNGTMMGTIRESSLILDLISASSLMKVLREK